MKVMAYLKTGAQHSWTVGSYSKAQEYASRIIREGLMTDPDPSDGSQTYYPPHEVYKVKIIGIV